MPAQSQQQQKLFGLALSVKRGKTPRSEASTDVLNIVDTMSEKEIEDFAGTAHKGLPKKVEETIREMVRTNLSESIPKMYKTFLAVQKKVKELESSQKDLLEKWKSEKDDKKKAKLFDKLKQGTKVLKATRKNLSDIEEKFVNNMSYDTSYSESMNEDENPCWKGYEMVGMKMKNGKEVPNCVPKNESVNEAASRTAKEIGGLTGMNKDFVQKFVDTNELDIEKVFQFVKKGKLKDRMDFVSAVAGKPNNPLQKKMIKMFK